DYFSDDNDSTFEDDINRLRHAGITTGCAADKFCADQPVTRGQMAAFLYRARDLIAATRQQTP
ncbi:MAG: S-layer homology domain-containing protein, partial [Acidimicrobiaceae bacterium]|nr:S-layer homology domain-containing protein [Acidimicrobiaceae bacterium]